MGQAQRLFSLLPKHVLDEIYRKKDAHWRYSEAINEVRIKKYLEGCVKGNKNQIAPTSFCEINKLEWDYPIFNICFFENVIKCGTFCLTNGKLPVVTFVNSRDRVNLWETIMEQPYGLPETPVKDSCKDEKPPLYFPAFPSSDLDMYFGYLYNVFWKPNNAVKEYFDEEYRTLLEGKRVLGVLSRGTDYITTKPKGHPRQPEIKELIPKVEKAFSELKCEAIYLATEEYRVQMEFEKAFPGKIIINKRVYFDQYYDIFENNHRALISAVDSGREKDSYWKSVEYLSSVNLLSKCCGLVAGCCGGSRAAYYLNNGKYEYCYLFNLGLYE